MDLNGPNANIHYRGINHQHDEVRLIDYARLCEHLSSRKIILLQLFRAIFRRLNQRCLPLKEEDTTRSTPPEFVYTEDVLLPSLVLFLTRNFEWELPNLIQHLAKVYPDNDFITEYSQSIAKLAKATLVDIIDLFHDLSKFIQKRGESNFANENQLGHQSDKLHYTIKGWSLVGLFLRRHICSFEMLSTPSLEQLVSDVSRYVDSYLRSSTFKCPLPPKDDKMMTEFESTNEIKKNTSIRELRIQTKQYSSSEMTIPVSIKQAEYMLTKLALRLDAGILVDDYELEILRSIEKIYPQLAEVPFVHYLQARSKNNYSQANYYLHHYFDKQNGFQLTSDIGALHMSTLLSHYNFKVDAKNALNDGMSMSLLRSEKDIMPLCVDQLISSTLNTSQKVDNLLLLDNRYLKQLDNSSAGFLTTDDCVCVESWPSVQLMSRGNLPAVLQRIDTDFERTDVKSRFNWINRAAVHYLNKTAFWNLAQYNDFVLLYSAMVLDNSEHLHLRHTDYYALACSYLSMAILNQGQYNLASQMLNKSIDLVQLSTNAHNLIDMARADVQFVLQCRRSEWDRALVTAKTFSNYSQIEYEIRRAICLHNLNELDDSQRDPIELQKLLNQEKVSDLISRIKLLLLLTENCAKKNDLVPSLGFLEECKQLCIKYNLQHYLILCLLYEVQLNKSNFTTSQESIRILTFCLTELLKYGDRYNVARCALLLGRLYLLEMAEDRVYPNYSSDAEHLLLLAKDIFTSFQETLHLKLTYLYLVFTYHDSIQVEKRKQMAKLYKQIDVKLDNKPTVI
ncbi:unnamed protein product [Rotaria magnacalcarata]|uniref:Anaphase-promoting complex subunit 5 n=1 Tax=Rotaria magnacalcarata TaxID=392030 RepID=A0A819GXW2_9BILA|nr:unnamed protein product [Rotaria magnacalcarata]CAF1351795.1 unnamed protein product [Rotaria magnacalcarata]CAF1945755.1 unnamed protein product [Rotaria magnacalcarata]CAF2081941.1 unnamed protein product [Rotaria magnacalcarata]CAF2122967.1 unnamed protein product [Rotaria magnacalcarata]